MKINTFEEIIAWKKAKELNIHIYNIFVKSKDFVFKDQILRCTLSIMNNIAEGFERGSNRDFSKFLFISKGSCAELRSMLYLALEFKFINEDEFQNLSKSSIEISRMLSGLIKSLK